jgi:hypothetical protein
VLAALLQSKRSPLHRGAAPPIAWRWSLATTRNSPYPRRGPHQLAKESVPGDSWKNIKERYQQRSPLTLKAVVGVSRDQSWPMNPPCLAPHPEDHPRSACSCLTQGRSSPRPKESPYYSSFILSFQDFAWSIEVRVFVLLRLNGAEAAVEAGYLSLADLSTHYCSSLQVVS